MRLPLPISWTCRASAPDRNRVICPRYMGYPVYSTQFLNLEFTSPGTEGDYVVPSGYVAIVRDIDGVIFGATSTPTAGLVLVPAGGTERVVIGLVGTEFGSAYVMTFRGRQVFNAGDTLSVVTTAPGTFMVSGYLLTAS